MTIPSASWLDLRITVQPSPIDGLGLLATASIAPGEIVEVLGGTILADAQVQAMIDDGQRSDGIGLGPDRNLLLDPSWPGICGNHSCDPNLWMQDAVTISSRRQIAPGDELTIDYALLTNPGWSMPCRCGSQRCRGVVTGNDWHRSDLQARCRGHFAPVHHRVDQQQVSPDHPPAATW